MKFSIIVVNGKSKHLPQVKIIEKANKRKQNDGINSSLAVLLCYVLSLRPLLCMVLSPHEDTLEPN